MNSKFHLAFKVKDIESTIYFYHTILGCKIGRQTKNWVDFDFFGHQLSAHVSNNIIELDYCGMVDNIKVPIPHFGCIISNSEFSEIKLKLKKYNVKFIIAPQVRYKNKNEEQQTMFVLDLSNNPLEFKSFKNNDAIYS
ncbi:VOC family protein [Tenacibaculum halocynthiae]|uniref:VOC family protein n=1 Tax=Tenacibaculum halocynthiae TaxID=1254437 RepID=UPI003D6610FE